MIVLLVLQAVVLVVLSVLVVGLLRSHAEILRRLHELGAGVYDEGETGSTGATGSTGETGSTGATGRVELTEPPPAGRQPEIRTVAGVPEPRQAPTGVRDIVGTTPDGGAKAIGLVEAPTTALLAFLSSGCGTCMDFWRAFRDGEADEVLAGVRLVVVTKGPDDESQAAVAALAPPGITTVMSSEAYDDYGVPVSPYFILVDGRTSSIIGEGAAATWQQVAHLLTQAAADAGMSDRLARGASGDRGAARLNGDEREARADAELLAAGITPGHASLYPERASDEASSPTEEGA